MTPVTLTLRREYWTDGSVYPNPGRGGWAVVNDSLELEYMGWSTFTTNIQMEGHAIRCALDLISRRQQAATIWTDSEFWIKAIKGEYRNVSKNRELLAALQMGYHARPKGAELLWVKGHAGNPGNEKADEYAGLARAEANKEYESLKNDRTIDRINRERASS